MAKRRGKKQKHWEEILVYRYRGPKRHGSLRRAYKEYRAEHNIAYRCDIDGCQFHDPESACFQNGKPMWLGKELPLLVDHIQANTRDNRPSNLRLVCPNCAFQLPTHGGANKNMRINDGDWGYVWKAPGGKVDCVYFPQSLALEVTGSAIAEVST